MESERRSQRYPSNRPLRMRCETWSEFVQMYASDVCRGGMFIRTEAPLEVLSAVEVYLELPQGTEVALNARVVHVVSSEQAALNDRPAGVGIEFLHVDAQQRRQILQLVEFARSQAASADPDASFSRALLESTPSLPPKLVAAQLATLPDSATAPGTVRSSKPSTSALPAVQPDARPQSGPISQALSHVNASRQVARGPSVQFEPADGAGANPTRQATRGPSLQLDAHDIANANPSRQVARAPSAPLGTQGSPSANPSRQVARSPSAQLGTQGSASSNPSRQVARSPSAQLGTQGSASSNPSRQVARSPSATVGSPPGRAVTDPLDPNSPARAPSGPLPADASARNTNSSRSSAHNTAVPGEASATTTPSGQPLGPSKPTDLNRLKLVLNSLSHKHYEDAARLAREMLVDNPGDPQVLKWQAVCFARIALVRLDTANAAEHYLKVLHYDESNREAREFVRAYQRDRRLNSLPFGRYFVKKK